MSEEDNLTTNSNWNDAFWTAFSKDDEDEMNRLLWMSHEDLIKEFG